MSDRGRRRLAIRSYRDYDDGEEDDYYEYSGCGSFASDLERLCRVRLIHWNRKMAWLRRPIPKMLYQTRLDLDRFWVLKTIFKASPNHW